nr:hypothetical protein CFP56_63026 [Quercus suber]
MEVASFPYSASQSACGSHHPQSISMIDSSIVPEFWLCIKVGRFLSLSARGWWRRVRYTSVVHTTVEVSSPDEPFRTTRPPPYLTYFHQGSAASAGPKRRSSITSLETDMYARHSSADQSVSWTIWPKDRNQVIRADVCRPVDAGRGLGEAPLPDTQSFHRRHRMTVDVVGPDVSDAKASDESF